MNISDLIDIQIKIARSNGSTQIVNLLNIDFNDMIGNVVWLQGDEVAGKKIPIRDLLILNPTLPTFVKCPTINEAFTYVQKIIQKDNVSKITGPQEEVSNKNILKDKSNKLTFSPITSNRNILNKNNKINIYLIKLPLNKKEIETVNIVNKKTIIFKEHKTKVDLSSYISDQKFNFDHVFENNYNAEFIYANTAKHTLKTVIKGGHGACFNYGYDKIKKITDNDVFAITIQDMFQRLNKKVCKDVCVMSYLEIYLDKIYDMLDSKNKILTIGSRIGKMKNAGFTEELVGSYKDVMHYVKRAKRKSTKSHLVLQFTLVNSKTNEINGKLFIIDLAVLRRISTTSQDENEIKEVVENNKSLLALKECTRAIENGNHLPYRSSKLTLLLKDSLINEKLKMCMITSISFGHNSCKRTLEILKYLKSFYEE